MKFRRLVRLTVALLALPILAYAQDATLSGTVKDNTGGVLPGVTVTATNEASGITFVSVTDERGLYRIPVRAGSYKITAELAGFTTAARPGIELLLGRVVTLDFNMQVSSLQETVTVTVSCSEDTCMLKSSVTARPRSISMPGRAAVVNPASSAVIL